MANIKREDITVPEEWLRIIEKPDGSWKKIIFYNTSVGALLQHNEKMIAKMEYVFRVFQENQEDVALLWRPHPLIQATIESIKCFMPSILSSSSGLISLSTKYGMYINVCGIAWKAYGRQQRQTQTVMPM